MPGFVFILIAALALYLFFRRGNGRNTYSSRKTNSIDPAEMHHTDYGADVNHDEFHHLHHSHHSSHTHDHTDFSADSSSDSIMDFGSDNSFDSGSDFSSDSDSRSVD